MEAVKKLEFFQLVAKPVNRKKISMKWVFKSKEGEPGKITNLEARWVIKRYLQTHGVAYDLTNAPVSVVI